MAIRAALFDATGTLITPAEKVGATYARVAAEFGVELPASRLTDTFGRVLRHSPPRVFPDAESAEETVRLERAWWRERVRQTFQATDSTVRFADFDAFFDALYGVFARGSAWRLFADAREALIALRERGLLLGVVSNFDHRLPNILEDLDIARFFGSVIIPRRCGAAKPDPALFRAALRELNAAPETTVYIGDDAEEDLAAISAAGMQVIDVRGLGGLGALPAAIDRLANLEA